MRVDNINLFGAGSGTGNVATASFVTSASFAQTASYVAGGNTGWTSETITITGTSGNPSKATTKEYDVIRYRTTGPKQYEIDMLYQHIDSSGTSAGSGLYLFRLPGGLSFDFNVHPWWENTTSIFQPSNFGAQAAHLRGSSGFFSNLSAIGFLGARAHTSNTFVIGTSGNFGGSGQASLNLLLTSTQYPITPMNYAISMRFNMTAA